MHNLTRNIRQIIVIALLALLTSCASTPNGKSIGERIDDSAIATKIKTALVTNRATDGFDIEVEVFKGRVQLNGFADNQAEVVRAEEIARRVKGVASVENNLTVVQGKRRVGQYLDDKGLVARVKTALARNRNVSALEIEVEVNRGVVQLGGFVNDTKQRQDAGAIVAAVGGVKQVKNNLAIKSGEIYAAPTQLTPAAPANGNRRFEETYPEPQPVLE